MRRLSHVLLLLLGSLVGATPGCGSGDENINNKPENDDKADAGVDTTTEGSASSNASGSAAATSNGASTAATSAGASSSSSSSGETSGETVPLGTVVGVGCDEDSDCVAPTTCIRQNDSFAGAFPGTGICSMPCEVNADCTAVDGFAYCEYVGFASDETIANTPDGEVPEGFTTMCMQLCFFGQSDPSKCGGLDTFTCAPLDDVVRADATGQLEFMLGGCTPLCNSDSDCESGESCDHSWGLCLEDQAEGKAIGEVCNLNATESECASEFCMAIAAELDTGFCSAPCNFHPEKTVCDGEISADAMAGCIANLFTPIASSLGDIAQCVPLCDADDDCPSGLACDLSNPEAAVEYFGRSGLCFPTEESVAEAIENMGGPDPVDADAGVTDVGSTSSAGDGG